VCNIDRGTITKPLYTRVGQNQKCPRTAKVSQSCAYAAAVRALSVLLLVLAALALYEVLRAAVLRAARKALLLRARRFAEQHQVRVDLFKFGGRQLVREELLNDLVVTDAMQRAARGELKDKDGHPLPAVRPEEVRHRVEEYIEEIVPAFSLTAYFQLGMTLARAAIHAAYRPLVDQASLERITALPKDATAVFLINHRSNFDYVVVGWALARQVAISYAVGEWARVFPLDALFRAFGGFFVRRGFPDPLYHTVLRRYLQLITRQGITQGIFPEGGLTRDGALRAPKIGLLDALLQLGADPAFGRELYFVPVGINYDRVLEDETLLAERRGRERPPSAAEKLRGALRLLVVVPWGIAVNLARVLSGRLPRHGYVAVAFGEPLRFRELAAAQGLSAERLSALGDGERRELARRIAHRLMESIGRAVPATPVPLVARALLQGGEPREAELASRVRALRAELGARGVPVALGEEFEEVRRGRAALEEDEDRNRDLARLEGELLASEEDEAIVRLGLERLARRRLVTLREGRVAEGARPHAREFLEYYARSLEAPAPPAPVSKAAEAAAPR
jgi:glycerol-3-phosphate O-acyltransferase